MRVIARRSVAIPAVALACSLALVAHAQDAGLPDAMALPWADVAPALDAARTSVVTVALGVADERRGPLSAQRLSARREAEARARQALHAWADAAMAHAALDAATVAAVHHAIDAHAVVTATRARVDGSACVRVSLSLRELDASTPGVRGLPWS